ncbi:hypothetical protein DPMN_154556 [Dreissena polymorpha]|uniref:Uncharacterized protein n=1 Tax=Dreissena polymorpha TaxID=45954 RepID=A0A9D4JA14_DREPO|nr:hypothetical protein DPMN_154556 [Dreissena polymorpha]
MLKCIKIPHLQENMKANRLIFFYKMVEGLVPALPNQYFLTPVRQSKRRVTPTTFSDFKVDNIVENYSTQLAVSSQLSYSWTNHPLYRCTDAERLCNVSI